MRAVGLVAIRRSNTIASAPSTNSNARNGVRKNTASGSLGSHRIAAASDTAPASAMPANTCRVRFNSTSIRGLTR